MMITLAFYKGRGGTLFDRIQDAAIRIFTFGKYSHVELIPGRAISDEIAACFSSSARDGGVRIKEIRVTKDRWDLVYLPKNAEVATRFIVDRDGKKYDYLGILLSQVFPFGIQSESKWFCSEICAAAIGLTDPHKISPNKLFRIVTKEIRDV